MTIRYVLALLGLCASLCSLPAQVSALPTLRYRLEPSGSTDSPIGEVVSYEIDWQRALIRIRIVRPTSTPSGASALQPAIQSPAQVARTQAAIERDAPSPIARVLLEVPLNSRESVSDRARVDDRTMLRVDEIARRARTVDAYATPTMSHAVVEFELHLHRDVAAGLSERTTAGPVPARLEWVPTTSFTGILIYAADELPVFGTDNRSTLRPALFPGIHYRGSADGLLYPLLDSSKVDPAVLAESGTVHYDRRVDSIALLARVGAQPLRIAAVGLFGRSPTDIVIEEHDALRILASSHNRDLLRTGRIAVVLPGDAR